MEGRKLLEQYANGKRDFSWATLFSANLSRANLSQADLSRANLSRADLSRATLFSADLSRANLYGANLSGANLSRADLSGANLSEANLHGAILCAADLRGATLCAADLRGAHLRRANLRGAKCYPRFATGTPGFPYRATSSFSYRATSAGAVFSSADLWEADLTDADLRGAKLDNTNLNCAQLVNTVLCSSNLSGVELRAANLSGADLFDTNLSEANLSEANLSEANLSEANLRLSYLAGANLSRANLSRANLSLAYLCRANLRGANLTSADLRANLHQADLRGADLRGADLRGATLLNLGFVDAETSLARWNLRLEGELSEITAAVLTEIEAELRARLYDPQLKIRGFRLGSVILELAMSEDAAQLLQRLFKDGDLQQIMGYRILALEERLASEPAKVTTILVLGANPVDAAPLALDREMRAIEKAIRESKYKDSIELISRWAVGLEDLQLALLEHQPEIVHFSGHGLAEGVMLVNESGNGHVMQPELLAAVVCAVQDNVRLAVFNACYSHVQAEAITKHIDCAIGMAHTIDDGAALKFASAFYRAIGLGRSLQEAFDLGKATYHSVADVHACGPTMTVKDGVKPSDLCFFTPPAKKTRARKPSSLDSRAAVTAPATE